MNKILEVIEGKRKAPITKALLSVMSGAYRLGSSFRFAREMRLDIPVISVGNIVAGGTGKTPIVHYLASALSAKKIAILSRGYKRKSRKQGLLIEKETTWEECGDEPFLLFQKLPEANIIVGSDRVYGGHLAQEMGAELVLLDDGFQYKRLHRDYDIVCVNAADPFGKGHFLPRGYLRSSPKTLARASLILVTNVRDEEHFLKIQSLMQLYSKAPIVSMELSVENSTKIASKKVAAFSAIAGPTRFENTLKTLGCDIVLKQEKPDHDPFAEEELEQLANLAEGKGAVALVCTEKDAVKLPQDLKLALPIIPVEIALEPTFGKEHLNRFIQGVLT